MRSVIMFISVTLVRAPADMDTPAKHLKARYPYKRGKEMLAIFLSKRIISETLISYMLF